MSDTMSMFTKIVEKFQNKPDTFKYLIDKNQGVAKMISDIYDRYMNIPKFSDIIKEDPRKYKSYYCESRSSSVAGFLRILKRYKFYQAEKMKDDWDIYIPNGYNRVEVDLEKLQTTRDEQIVLGIQGCDDLVGKTCLWNILENTYGREKAREILPETFVFANEEHMKLFLEKYKEGEIYILKKKRQRKEGLQLTKSIDEILDAKKNDFTLVQNYKRDLLLINNRKLNLRIYLLLTFKDGVLEAHINKYGTCIYNNKDYDDSTLDFEHNITSFNLDHEIYKRNPLTLKQLKTYLLDHGYDNPDVLFERINEKVRLVVDAIKPSLGKHGNLNKNLCTQIFGMDFIVDKDLNPFMLECNKGPDMSPKNDTSYAKLLNKLDEFYIAEDLVDKCYPDGYKSGNGLKVQRDMFNLLGIIDSKLSNNGFYKVY